VAVLLHEQPVDRAAALALERQPVGDLLIDAHRRRALVLGLGLGARRRGGDERGRDDDEAEGDQDGLTASLGRFGWGRSW
jgi:hypothetical protein